MGRPKLYIDEEALLEMRGEGRSIREIASSLEASTATVSRRLADLRLQGVLTKYREIQGLRLTELQAVFLESISEKDLDEASLLEKVKAFAVLKKAELRIRGKETVRFPGGLVGYLRELEKEEERIITKRHAKIKCNR